MGDDSHSTAANASQRFRRKFQQPRPRTIFQHPDRAVRALLHFADPFAHRVAFGFAAGDAVELDAHQRLR